MLGWRFAVAGLALASGCGRFGFDPGNYSGRDSGGTQDSSVDLNDGPIDGPSVFGTFTGPSAGRALTVIQPDDDVAITGWFEAPTDFGAGTFTPSGGRDAVVARYTSTGVTRWARAFGTAGEEIPNGIAADDQENVYVTGSIDTSISFGGATLTNVGGTDAYVVSLDPDGQHRWSQRIASGGGDSGRSVAVAADGSVYVVGRVVGTANAGGTDFSCAASDQAIMLAAYTRDGAHRWSRCYGTSAFNSARGVGVDAAGNIYVLGYYTGAADLGGGAMPTAQGLDVFVASYTSAGTYRWSRGFGGSGDDWGNAIAADADGNVVVTGFFTGIANLGGADLTASGATDGFIASYDSLGVHRWSRQFGGTGCDLGAGATITSTDVYVAGQFGGSASFGGGSITSNGSSDAFLVRYTSAGAFVEQRQIGAALADIMEQIAPIAGGVVATGELDSTGSACPNSGTGGNGVLVLQSYAL